MTGRVTAYRHDGLTFTVRDEGPLDGPVVVLLHGFPQRASSWNRVVPHLHAAGLRTVVPDQRGYSPGARPRRRWEYRSDRLVGDVVALVDELGIAPVHLVGHDWGAAVGWLAVMHHPKHFASWTAVSVAHPQAFLRSLRSRDQLRRSWYMGFFQLPGIPERALSHRARATGVLRAGGMDRDMVQRYFTEVLDDGALRGGLSWYRGLMFTNPSYARGQVPVPTTYVWSDGDVALGRRGADLTARYVDADYRLEVLPGVSHWIPEETPETLARIILERIGGTAPATGTSLD
jgi:pimeloyl-ACP methyl ester carboxylesterase